MILYTLRPEVFVWIWIREISRQKFVVFGKKNTGISQINGLDDLCQGWPSKAKAKDLQSQGQGQGHKFWP